MATPDWLARTEAVIGANHPIFSNTKDRPGQTINTAFSAEHDEATGMHDARPAGMVIEQDSFTGNGAARTITLSNTGLTPKKVMVWEAGSGADLVSNGGFDSDTTDWVASVGSTLASVAGGQSGNCLQITNGENVLNGGFDSDTSNWTLTGDGSLASVAGGVSGNCLQITFSGTIWPSANQTVSGLIPSAGYSLSAYVKDGSVAGGDFRIYWDSVFQFSEATTSSWVKKTAAVTASGTTGVIRLEKYSAGAGTILFDSVTLTRAAVSTATQSITGLTIGRQYTLSGYIKSGTSGDEAYTITFDGATIASGTSSGSWVQWSGVRVYTGTSNNVILTKNTTTPGTMLFDTVTATITGGAAPLRIDTMTSEKAQPSRYLTTAWAVDIIDNFQAGSFDVENYCNSSGTTNHYLVIGIDTTTVFTGDSGAGSDPDWIDSGVLSPIIADDTATVSTGNIANDVESQIWTEFIEEHTDVGVHSITLQNMRVETGEYDGNDADDRDIATDLTDLDIKYLCVLKNGAVVSSKSESMSGDTTKNEATAAFAANYIQSLGTGTFQVGTALNASGSTYVYYAIGV